LPPTAVFLVAVHSQKTGIDDQVPALVESDVSSTAVRRKRL
jgi:hypothetical protein